VGVRRGGCGGSGLYCDIDNEMSRHREVYRECYISIYTKVIYLGVIKVS